MSLINTYYLCKKLDIKILVIDDSFDWFRDSIIIDNIKIIKNQFIDLSDKTSIESNFFHKVTLSLFYDKDFNYNLIGKLKVEFNFKPSVCTTENSDCLWIHVRSEKICQGNGINKVYGQPLLSFYKKIINENSYKTVNLVTEDMSNPCLEPLIKWLLDINQKFQLFSSNVKSDIENLLSAENIVIARGTFIMPILCISHNIKRVYAFHETRLKTWGIDSPNQKSHIGVIMYKDASGNYSEILKNWNNSEAQRQKMIEYSEDEIGIDYIHYSKYDTSD
jgi:hypothetical protein